MRERTAQIKETVEDHRVKVRELQQALADHKLKQGSIPPEKWKSERSRLKKDLDLHLRILGRAKADLVKLSGTTGSDPKWLLLPRAYRILQRLEDQNVDIGEDGRKLLDDITFHVPASKLVEALSEESEERS